MYLPFQAVQRPLFGGGSSISGHVIPLAFGETSSLNTELRSMHCQQIGLLGLALGETYVRYGYILFPAGNYCNRSDLAF